MNTKEASLFKQIEATLQMFRYNSYIFQLKAFGAIHKRCPIFWPTLLTTYLPLSDFMLE